MNLLSVEGHVALVTGASSGLGRSFAMTLAEHGAAVVLAARRKDKLDDFEAELKSAGHQALAVEMDVTKAESVEAALNGIEETFKEPAGIIVNNAGISRDGWATELTEEEFSEVLETNLTSVWRVAKATALRLIKAGKGGSIVNIASITALRPAHLLSAYASSKAGVDHLTRVMAIEMTRNNIRVNALAPGYYETDINSDFLNSEAGDRMRKRVPMRRFGKHHELSGPLMLLASDAGSYMTGATIVVDGGHTVMSL